MKPKGYVTRDGARFIVCFGSKTRAAIEDLHLLADTEMRLVANGEHYGFEYGNAPTDRDTLMLRMFAEGAMGTTIAKAANLSTSAITKAKKRFIETGLLDESTGKLTSKGMAEAYGDAIRERI
jgi:hypothetical protein